MAPSTTDDLSLVPAHRLGQLLSRLRHARRLELATIVERTGQRWTEIDLRAIEAGQHPLNDGDTLDLLAAYEVPPSAKSSERCVLELDRDGASITMAGSIIRIGPEIDLATIATRYLSLVTLLRQGPAPTSVAELRSADIDVLCAATASSLEELSSALSTCLASGAHIQMSEALDLRVRVPEAGVLVAPAEHGTLVLNQTGFDTVVG